MARMISLSKKTTVVSPTTHAFVSAVRQRLDDEGITQQDLARRSTLSAAEVSQMLNCYSNPTTTNMDKFANAAFGVDAFELIANWHNSHAAAGH